MNTTTHNGTTGLPQKQSGQTTPPSRVLAALFRNGRPILAYLSGERGAQDSIAKTRVAISAVFAATLAGLAGATASSYILPGFWPALVGLGWGLLILNFDTMILGLLGDRAGRSRLLAISPRLPVVALSSAVFVELLVLRVFTPEVDHELARRHQEVASEERIKIDDRHDAVTKANHARFAEDIAGREKALGELQSKIDDAEERRRQAGSRTLDAVRERRLVQSPDGGFYFDSSVSRAAHAEEQRLGSEVEKLREQLDPEFKRNREEIVRLRSEQLAEQRRIDDRREDDLHALQSTPASTGLIARIVALEEICRANRSAWWARLLLGLLLFAVELLPTLAKLGERSDSALIREHLHEQLREALKSDSLKKRIALWMETSTFGYVNSYLRDVDTAMGVGERFRADSKKPSPELGDDADSRIRRLLRHRTQTDQQASAE